jgi:hypothetical protein
MVSGRGALVRPWIGSPASLESGNADWTLLGRCVEPSTQENRRASPDPFN